MRQTTLLGFFKPRTLEIIGQCIPRVTDHVLPIPASSPSKKEQDASLESVQKPESLSPQPSSSVTSLSATILAQSEVFVPTQCPEAAIVRIREIHLPRIRSITNVLLPVRYPDKFFNECIHDPSVSDFCRVVLWNSEPIGWIRCRTEPDSDDSCKLYIQAIGVLAPYRGLGLATMLLDCIIQPTLMEKHNLKSVYAHLWEANIDAREWYEKRGFEPVAFEPSYYRRLQPAGAWVMTKALCSRTLPTHEANQEDQYCSIQSRFTRP